MENIQADETRTLTDADVRAIVKELQKVNHSSCRFSEIDPRILVGAVEFYETVSSITSQSGKIIGKTVLVSLVLGTITIIGIGIVTKIKEAIGQ